MNQDYIQPNPWSILEEGFNPKHVKSSESLFSIGNGAMGQRANFEEKYTGNTFQGSYIAGVYYPDKTRVGWWKNGYPEYFAKVLNAPSWIGINVIINNEVLDLNTCAKIKNFKRDLNMKEGVLYRSFQATLQNGIEIAVKSTRFLSLAYDELGVINFEVIPINQDATISFTSYLDSDIKNQDSNWDDQFWDTTHVLIENHQAHIHSNTRKTFFYVNTFMENKTFLNGKELLIAPKISSTPIFASMCFTKKILKGDIFSIQKLGGYTTSLNHDIDKLILAAKNTLEIATNLGFEKLKQTQINSWDNIWQKSDVTIEGDVKAQQGIRFAIFQLNQTYLGKDSRLNIGPKGFTGEKYGGSTYWDTEAYCIPFYMVTKNNLVARNLLAYRYSQLDKAIDNATKLGFSNGAALFPMVTMNGEECHNEWEITFEEIHRNGAIAFAIFNYVRYTGDYNYIPEKGLEVLIAIARFWQQRASFSTEKNKYVILGVTGPNEYENNVNNNWYTNYIAKWCIDYAVEQINYIKEHIKKEYARIMHKVKLSQAEILKWKSVAENLYFPYDENKKVFLQQEGFLDKELIPVKELDKTQRPINQNWSWDKILRSVYIKQADVLQGFYFFEDHFTTEVLERHFNFYEPFTVHESSLSPCVHAIQAAKLGRLEQAYQFYLRSSRLDLEDYNQEVEEGCHITSMAGTWMSIVEGFGGMRIKKNNLCFSPKIPNQWISYSFKINFRGQIIQVDVTKEGSTFELHGNTPIEIVLHKKTLTLNPNKKMIL
ncbi:MAG: family 65 glycosyl hydrolase [Flavobacteriaceae bacterium CG2_30_34_30]|nr:glycoside hydrolase family 65 protein [Flavobacteriales bacterium]NCT17402.1 glycoside hydrolase family 65 protein [Flavobacteriia bacterium]OIP52027.1 MAG: family 65 glycosyl hydrolase [Flavobacteriaceae bacterium CG2_30_34_30]PIQ17468.1 MAG: family 65 glycosyl hydrolase [Flavobacteriaceae bacterium CG18_big_fil_WC_8_21_14_2_50_34_36]PIV48898.1 MAG: family 65 glycosyl hydrolase [Flavobacteriaceae bacterium CG02_land_8_20_14_3_00_34_13]PIZ07170.1 MAG: family 65 glycosyl hydrolase [Flavobact